MTGHRSQSRFREAAALVLVAGAVFLLLALASYRVPAVDFGEPADGWVGPVGGFLSRWLVQGFGVVAWLVPVEVGLVALPLFRGRSHADLGLRVAGDLTLAIVLSALSQVVAPGTHVFGHGLVGGNVGLLFGELMRGLFSTIGSLLVGFSIVGLILIGRSSFSFIDACRRALELAKALSLRLGVVSERVAGAWKQARALRRSEREAERREPRIEPVDPDAAILAELAADDDTDWNPIERTGAPPLALSQALRSGAAGSSALVAALAETPAPSDVLPVASDAKARPRGEKKEPKAPKNERKGDEKTEKKLDEKPVTKRDERLDEKPEARTEPKAAPKAEPKGETELRIVDTKPEREVERVESKKKPETRRGQFASPSTELLDPPPPAVVQIDRESIYDNARRLEKTLADYDVTAKVEEVRPGPTVTMYEVSCQAGTRVSKVASLVDDLALGLSRKVRIIAPIPGKSLIGFELPNDERQPVCLRELIEDQRFEKLAERCPLPIVLGRDIVGAPFYADLASMPHVIVAGATGAGKSVGLNVMLSSLLFKRSPEELRFLMIDPKVVELAPFDGIPHMLLPVVTDMKQAATALRWAVEEMERRYQLFADAGTKNITTYNAWVKRVHAGEIPAPAPETVEALTVDGALLTVPAAKDGSDGRPLPGKLPYIVIVVDEFADLMMQQGKDVEAAVARLAQKARAAGMHVVLATQRPSVDVITGTIKANFPTRIAFRVSQRVDSKTILDEQGAELLLGRGDMLVKLNGSTETHRAQCPFVSEEEVNRLTDYLRTQGTPEYHEAILAASPEDEEADEEQELDARFDEAVRIVSETRRCSTSWLQRKMTIGYNRAAKIVETMERRGLVGPPNGARDREVLMGPS
ncbi:MAG TPA: DNA translocase FtsK 4TM domain-containing protein [Polyangiaceae bacterium]